jgi:cell division septation protein DedD
MTLRPGDDDRLWRESEETSRFRFPPPTRYIVFVVVLILLLIGLWYLISPKHEWHGEGNLTLIQADEAPYKIKAENQGVPHVQHQDKLVYGRIRADQNAPLVEHILPDPELPVLPTEPEEAAVKMTEQYVPEDLDPEKAEMPSAIASIEDLIEEHSEPQQEDSKNAKGSFYIQLGSLKSYDMAEAEWERLSKQYAEILGGLTHFIQKIDLGAERGIYYRLRAGSFEEVAQASQICSELQTRKIECAVIH